MQNSDGEILVMGKTLVYNVNSKVPSIPKYMMPSFILSIGDQFLETNFIGDKFLRNQFNTQLTK